MTLRQTSCSISTSFPGAAAALSPLARYRVPGCRRLLRPNTASRNSLPLASVSLRDSARPCSNDGTAPGMPSARTGAASHSFHTHSPSGDAMDSSVACAKDRVTSKVSQ